MKKTLFWILGFFITLGVTTNVDASNDDVAWIDRGYPEPENDDAAEISLSEQQVIMPMSWIGVSIQNIEFDRFSFDLTTIIKSDTLAANGSNTFTLSYTRSTTVSGVLSINAVDINIELGVSENAQVSVTNSYTFECPSSYGGLQVIQCSVTYHPKYALYTFDEVFLGIKTGSGTSKVLVGFYQKVKYYYVYNV